MKSFCLINKRTGDLFEGYRVSLFDNHMVDKSGAVSLVILQMDEPDGWIIGSPHSAFGGYWIWFNEGSIGKIFEVLGEI